MIKNKFVLFAFVFVFLISFVSSLDISKQAALNEINSSKSIIQDMELHNLSTVFMNDLLIEAQNAYSRAYYAEILLSPNSSAQQIREASSVLTLINYKNVSYSDVLIYTNQIKDRQKEAFRLYDLLSLSNIQLINSQGISKADFFNLNLTLQKARVAFFNDRYSEANSSLNDFSVSFENIISQNTSLNGINASVSNFFQRNWIFILIVLFFVGVIISFVYHRHKINSLKRKIHKMKIEEVSLNNLIKDAQTDRFKKNSISELVYNIRVKKYEQLISNIKQELPVLENTLHRLRKGK